MQHAARDTRTAERIAVRSAVAATFSVEGHDVIDDLDDTVAQEFCLDGVEGITDDDETVSAEDLDGAVDLGWVEDLESVEPGIRFQVLALLDDLW